MFATLCHIRPRKEPMASAPTGKVEKHWPAGALDFEKLEARANSNGRSRL